MAKEYELILYMMQQRLWGAQLFWPIYLFSIQEAQKSLERDSQVK